MEAGGDAEEAVELGSSLLSLPYFIYMKITIRLQLGKVGVQGSV